MQIQGGGEEAEESAHGVRDGKSDLLYEPAHFRRERGFVTDAAE